MPQIANITEIEKRSTSITVQCATNIARGTLYVVAVPTGDPRPSRQQVIAGLDSNNSPAPSSNVDVTDMLPGVVVPNLQASFTYDFHAVQDVTPSDVLIVDAFDGDLSGWDEVAGAVAIVNGEARFTLINNTQNSNWLIKYFGTSNDAPVAQSPVPELWVRGKVRYTPDGSIWSAGDPPVTTIKIFQINWDDPFDIDGGKRRHQVQLMIRHLQTGHVLTCEIAQFDAAGNYISGAWVPDVAAPAVPVFDTDMYIKMYVKNNTNGQANGIVRIWLGDVLRIEQTDAVINDGRFDVNLTPNKLIVGTHDERGVATGDGYAYMDDIVCQRSDPGAWAAAKRFETLSLATFSCDHGDTTIPPAQNPPGLGVVYTSPDDGIEFNIDEHVLFSAGAGYSDANILQTKGIVTQIVDKAAPDGTALNGNVWYPNGGDVTVNLPNQLCYSMLLNISADFLSHFVDTYGAIRCKFVEVNCVTEAPEGGRPELYIWAVQDTRSEVTNTVQLPDGNRYYFVPVLAADPGLFTTEPDYRNDEFGVTNPQVSYDAGNVHTFNLLDYAGEWIALIGKFQWAEYGAGQHTIHVGTQTQGANAASKFSVVENSPLITVDSLATQAGHGNFVNIALNEWVIDTVGAGAGSIMEHDCVAIDTDFNTMLTGYPNWVTS